MHSLKNIDVLCFVALAVVPDDDFYDPLDLDDPPGSSTPPTPPVVASPSPQAGCWRWLQGVVWQLVGNGVAP